MKDDVHYYVIGLGDRAGESFGVSRPMSVRRIKWKA
jgi:hypothetical protein